MLRFVILATLTAGLAACAPGYYEPVSQRAAMRFDSQLAGLVAGQPQNCLSGLRSANVVAARGNTLLFRDGGTIYANDSGGGCSALADQSYTLVTENFGGSLCRGTLARVVDLTSSGVMRGSCVLGHFTPYRRP